MKETDLYKKFKEKLPASLHCTRMENDCSDGMPDVFIRKNTGQSFWIENKVCGPKEVLKWQPTQVPWMMKHALNYKGQSFTLIGDRKTCKIFVCIDMSRLTKEQYKKLIFEKIKLNELLIYIGEDNYLTSTCMKTIIKWMADRLDTLLVSKQVQAPNQCNPQ